MSRDRGKSLAILGGTEPQDVSCIKVATFLTYGMLKGLCYRDFADF